MANSDQVLTYLKVAPSKQPRSFIKSSVLVLIAFASVYFPRLLEAIGVPAAVNFLHFAIVPVTCGIVLFTSKFRNRHQLAIAHSLLFGLCLLFAVTTASALLNDAGLINVFLSLMLLTEPFLLLMAIMCIPFTIETLQRFRKWILGFAAIHLFLVYIQKVLLETGILGRTRMTQEDNIQGVFYLSWGGHVVSAFVSVAFALYFFVSAKTVPLWLRAGAIAAVFYQLLFADAKQVVLVCIFSWFLLIIARSKDIKVTLQYAIAAVLAVLLLHWCIHNVEVFRAYRTWIRPEIYGPDGDATVLKTGPLRIIPSYFTSSLNWLFGLGPGHTVGRLGGWMIRDYWSLVGPLGATESPVADAIWQTWNGHYLGSSFFSPFWGWAGIWGDSGFLGLAAYLSLWQIVWSRVCTDDLSRYLVLNVLLNGFIFTLMEEPGFMLTTTLLLGLRWHELRLERSQQLQEIMEAKSQRSLAV